MKTENEDYVNQHIVPRSFYKNFADDRGYLFSSEINVHTKKWQSPKERHIKKINTYENFYDVETKKSKYKGVDKKIIEKTFFWYEKNYFKELKLKLEKFGNFFFEDRLKLANVYFNMKQRNIVHREAFSKSAFLKRIPEIESDLYKKLIEFGFSEEYANKIVSYGRNYIENHKDFNKEMHNDALFESVVNPNENQINILKTLINSRIIIYYIKEENNFFITSDNPFYSVDKRDVIHHTKFVDDVFHIMPVTKKYTIVFQKEINDSIILYKEAKPEFIDAVNKASTMVKHKYIYGCHQESLQSLVNDLNNKL